MNVYIKTWGEGQILLTVFVKLTSVCHVFCFTSRLGSKNKFVHFTTVQTLFYSCQAKL